MNEERQITLLNWLIVVVAVAIMCAIWFGQKAYGQTLLPVADKCVSCARDGRGHILRSQAAKNRFKRLHPCPASGKRYGACPGYVIDHKLPLECGGKDAPSNMQWQTVAEGKAKDRWEGNCALARKRRH
jgi:hypothetical protein